MVVGTVVTENSVSQRIDWTRFSRPSSVDLLLIFDFGFQLVAAAFV